MIYHRDYILRPSSGCPQQQRRETTYSKELGLRLPGVILERTTHNQAHMASASTIDVAGVIARGN